MKSYSVVTTTYNDDYIYGCVPKSFISFSYLQNVAEINRNTCLFQFLMTYRINIIITVLPCSD